MLLEKITQQTCSPSPCQSLKWRNLGPKLDCHRYVQFSGSVEMRYREMLFQPETEHSDKELYQIIAQSRPVQMISYNCRLVMHSSKSY